MPGMRCLRCFFIYAVEYNHFTYRMCRSHSKCVLTNILILWFTWKEHNPPDNHGRQAPDVCYSSHLQRTKTTNTLTSSTQQHPLVTEFNAQWHTAHTPSLYATTKINVTTSSGDAIQWTLPFPPWPPPPPICILMSLSETDSRFFHVPGNSSLSRINMGVYMCIYI